MQCKKCGKEIEEGSKLCPSCQTQATPDAPEEKAAKPLLVLKPVFVPLVTLASILPFQIFIAIWMAAFWGFGGSVMVKTCTWNMPRWLPAVFFGGIFFYGMPLFIYRARKKRYKKIEYRFFSTELTYYGGFPFSGEKKLSYKDIGSVYLHKGIFQKRCGLGTIVFLTPTPDLQGNRSTHNRVALADIKGPDEIYRRVKALASSET